MVYSRKKYEASQFHVRRETKQKINKNKTLWSKTTELMKWYCRSTLDMNLIYCNVSIYIEPCIWRQAVAKKAGSLVWQVCLYMQSRLNLHLNLLILFLLLFSTHCALYIMCTVLSINDNFLWLDVIKRKRKWKFCAKIKNVN